MIHEQHRDGIDVTDLFLRYRVDCQIEVRVLEKPFAEEPVQASAAHVFHGLEEVARAGMLERPTPCVLAERFVERLGAENLVAKQRQADGGFHVGILAE